MQRSRWVRKSSKHCGVSTSFYKAPKHPTPTLARPRRAPRDHTLCHSEMATVREPRACSRALLGPLNPSADVFSNLSRYEINLKAQSHFSPSIYNRCRDSRNLGPREVHVSNSTNGELESATWRRRVSTFVKRATFSLPSPAVVAR